MNSASRVTINAAAIYITMLLKIIIGFISVRIVLQALGETDYGITNLVGGVVAMLDILNNNMSNASMRFLAHSLGSKDQNHICKTFNTTLFLHYMIGAITIVIMEIGGWLMFKYVLNIPEARMNTAYIIYQISILTTFISIIAVPYDAVINAHEHLWFLSACNVAHSLILLICAFFLLHAPGDRLILYSIYCFLVFLFLRIVKVAYSKHHFEECRDVSLKKREPKYIRSILGFTGWSLFGSLSAIASTQLRGIILNMFFGVRLNASEGIAKSVTNYVNQFASSISRAINPQIMKSEGGGNRERMKTVVEVSSKFSAFLLALVGIPVLLDAPLILKIWLKDVPEFAVIFSQIIIVDLLIDKLSNQMNAAIYAVGNIRNFQVIESTLSLMQIPVIFVLFKFSAPPETIYYVGLGMTCLKCLERFYFGHKLASIDVWHFFKAVFLPLVVCILTSLFVTLFVRHLIDNELLRFGVSLVVFILLFTILFFKFGINAFERNQIKGVISEFKNKIHKRKSNE